MESDASDLAIYIAIVIIIIVYYAPTIIAFRRSHSNRWLIAIVNTIFGGSGIGWLGALVWALHVAHISNQANGSNGGESGLNLVANDVRKTEIVGPYDISMELERLHALYEKNVITEEQYKALKGRTIGKITAK